MKWLDDVAHFAGAALFPVPAVLGWPVVSAILYGLLREHAQMQQKKKDLGHSWDWGWGRTRDMLGWLAGGALIQGVYWWLT